MIDFNILPSLLYSWQQNVMDEVHDANEQSHFDDETCYLLSLPNALNGAPSQTVAHLSSCPICLEKWADWLTARDLAEEKDSGDECLFSFSYGLLEAAADHKRVDGITSKSVCGKFKLSIFPKEDDLDCAMITVEYLSDNHECLEGHHYRVTEGGGKVIVAGQFRQGRLARITNEFQKINLDKWTIIEEQCQSE
jgi:hypothetical protein